METKKEEKRFDFHEPEKLKEYLDSWGRIKSRTKTGLTAEEHRKMVKAVKRARHLALLPEYRRKKDEVETADQEGQEEEK